MSLIKHLRLYECIQMLVPVVGGILTVGGSNSFLEIDTIVFLFGFYFHLLFVYTFNDWADFIKDQENPRKNSILLKKNRKVLLDLACLFFVVSMTVTLFIDEKILYIIFSLNILWAIYSLLHKRSIYFIDYGELLHFISGGLYFICGVYFYQKNLESLNIILTLYFGIVYLAGGILNELIDFKYDKDFGIKSLVLRIGERKGLSILLCSHFIIVLLFGIYYQTTWIYGIAFFAFIVYLIKVKKIMQHSLNQSVFIDLRNTSRLFFSMLTLVILASLI